jgi:hypothetical protein
VKEAGTDAKIGTMDLPRICPEPYGEVGKFAGSERPDKETEMLDLFEPNDKAHTYRRRRSMSAVSILFRSVFMTLEQR